MNREQEVRGRSESGEVKEQKYWNGQMMCDGRKAAIRRNFHL